MDKNIKPKAHPKHYMIHKYWGRKAHNIVNEYIKHYTKEGDVVLDPFMGSGVVVIESLKLGRQGVGVDINPMSCLIAQTTIDDFDKNSVIKSFDKIYDKNFKLFSELYLTKCPLCHKKTYFENSIWECNDFLRIKGTCNKCGKFKKDADEYDLEIVEKSRKIFNKLDNDKKIDYPKDEILQFVKRSGKTHINMLFSDRALVILGTIILDINKIKDSKIKELLMIVFTSMLPNVSKMIPGNIDKVRGRSGWVISKLWAPSIYTEKNIFVNFSERFNKIIKGKEEINNLLLKSSDAKILNKSSENLDFIKNESIDYIFTDPPYGDSIAYLGLSMFWNSWLKKKVLYDEEIIYDPCRNKRYEDFEDRIGRVYKELYRVLKNKKTLSFTFHNRNLRIWKAVIDAAVNAGFDLKNIIYQDQAVSSGTQGLNKKNTFKGDFVYNFTKNIDKVNIQKIDKKNGTELIIKHVKKWIGEDEIVTPDRLYEKLIPILIKSNSYVDSKDNVINIENVLKDNFTYGEKQNNNKIVYGWTI